MEFIYNGNSRKSGIYKITNKINEKIYIGSAKEFKRRANQHYSSLKKNKHQNKHLQASFNKHGPQAFIFEVIEVIEGDTFARRTKEERYLKKIHKDGKWNLCFNQTIKTQKKDVSKLVSKNRKNKTYEQIYGKRKGKQVKQKISNSHLGKTLSEEHKEKIRLNAKTNPGYGCKGKKMSQATKDKISQSRLGESHWFYGKKFSKEHRDKLKKTYITNLISPNGEIVKKIFGIQEFCVKNNLSNFALKAVIEGRRKTHKGWKLAK